MNFPTLDEVIKAHVLKALEAAGGNKAKAAGLLGVSIKTVYNHYNRMQSEGTTTTSGTELTTDSTLETTEALTAQNTESNANETTETNSLPTGSNSIFG